MGRKREKNVGKVGDECFTRERGEAGRAGRDTMRQGKGRRKGKTKLLYWEVEGNEACEKKGEGKRGNELCREGR